jgi:MOSC domain-containing protein YiiM
LCFSRREGQSAQRTTTLKDVKEELSLEYKLVSINVGKAQREIYKNKEIATGIYKIPIKEEVYVSKIQIGGDQQADLVNHGGKDQAICAYPIEHLEHWEKNLKQAFGVGGFGENFTLQGLDEENAHIGDTFEVGDVIIQISQPRRPCYKLGNRYRLEDLPLQVQSTGFTGFYFRVLKEGFIKPGQNLSLLERKKDNPTIAFVNNILYHDEDNLTALQQLAEVEELSERWRNSFQKKVEQLLAK